MPPRARARVQATGAESACRSYEMLWPAGCGVEKLQAAASPLPASSCLCLEGRTAASPWLAVARALETCRDTAEVSSLCPPLGRNESGVEPANTMKQAMSTMFAGIETGSFTGQLESHHGQPRCSAHSANTLSAAPDGGQCRAAKVAQPAALS